MIILTKPQIINENLANEQLSFENTKTKYTGRNTHTNKCLAQKIHLHFQEFNDQTYKSSVKHKDSVENGN